MVRASDIGAIDFTACDQTLRWWTGCRIRLRDVERQLGLKVRELIAMRAIGVQGMADLGQTPDFRQSFAIDAIQEFQAEAMPWFGDPKVQNVQARDNVDPLVQWYLEFADPKDIERWVNQ